MLQVGTYKIENHKVKIANQVLILRERKAGITAKKTKNFCSINSHSVYCSSFYPVGSNLPDSWEVLSFVELNSLGIYFFKMEFKECYYLAKIDIQAGMFQLSEDKAKHKKVG